MAAMINEARTVAIFGGDGCSAAQAETRALAEKLKAPVGYTLKGKVWLEHDNPNAVGMTGLLGYGGCWDAINHASRRGAVDARHRLPVPRVPAGARR
jgi:pyruvate dehydrogenase (quinone)